MVPATFAGLLRGQVCQRPVPAHFIKKGDVVGSQLRASNEALLRARVARAQRANQGAFPQPSASTGD